MTIRMNLTGTVSLSFGRRQRMKYSRVNDEPLSLVPERSRSLTDRKLFDVYDGVYTPFTVLFDLI